MNIIPPVKIERFEQLQPGDLFVYMNEGAGCFALKLERERDNDPNKMVFIGPDFPHDMKESYILPWQKATVVSHGKNFNIVLPGRAASWKPQTEMRKPVCLAVIEKEVFFCTNGGTSPEHYIPCYIGAATGKIHMSRPAGSIAFTHDWKITVPGPSDTSLSLLKYGMSA